MRPINLKQSATTDSSGSSIFVLECGGRYASALAASTFISLSSSRLRSNFDCRPVPVFKALFSSITATVAERIARCVSMKKDHA